MIEKGKISALQMALLMHPTILSTAALSVPAITMEKAGTDMWITPALSSVVGFLTVYLSCRLHRRFPKETLIEYCRSILGAYLGKAAAVVYLISFLYTMGIILREYGEFIVGTFLVKTPMIWVILCLVAVCAYAVREGLEVLGRAAQILIPGATFVIFGMLVIMLPDMHLKHMLPILENGPLPPLLGSIVPMSWFSQFIMVSFMLPYLSQPNKGLKWGYISVAAVLITLLAINLSILLLFGPLSKEFSYPFLNAVRYVALADFLEHIESLLMAAWLIGMFIKVVVVYYAAALGTAQWLGLPDYRPLIVPLGFLAILFSIWAAPNYQALKEILGTELPFFALTMQVVLPACLLGLAAIKGGRAT
ncbi:GerAB/ArcD/ProY family transporter [Cohnella nanjingensis]|uniref:Endospore germination permease n=1 Tax=Cohnella nanjingensis TaxID=1387779 RepID=A0A7X0RSE9_9BACL|nr:endospore germination permease [Cohnella nanjingensis]MBB6671550.1 endospore germination permease [Cohnella nanjingensis]